MKETNIDKKRAAYDAVQSALCNVLESFPEVTQVFFGVEGRWLFCDDHFESPDFETAKTGAIDLNLIQSAADAAGQDKGFPCAYSIYEVAAF